MTTPSRKPSIGRVVHYQSRGSADGKFEPLPRAALVTEVGGDGAIVGLAILNPTGMYFDRSIPYADEPTPGHWSWPPLV